MARLAWAWLLKRAELRDENRRVVSRLLCGRWPSQAPEALPYEFGRPGGSAVLTCPWPPSEGAEALPGQATGLGLPLAFGLDSDQNILNHPSTSKHSGTQPRE